jgi:PQQ-like domain
MTPNRTALIVISVILMLIIMGVAVFMATADIASREKFSAEASWSVPARASTSVNVLDLTGDKLRNVFVQDLNSIKVLDEQGKVLWEQSFPGTLASTQGDLNGDGVPDIVAYVSDGAGTRAIALNGRGESLWETALEIGAPGRIASVDFDNDKRSEVVVGDQAGQLVALSANGELLWRFAFGPRETLRGLDDVIMGNERAVVAGTESGAVALLDNQGRTLWSLSVAGGLRRLRSFPLGGAQRGYVLVGGVNGELSVYPARKDGGAPDWSVSLGQPVNEIRPAELDGDPATTEIIAGGKDGGIWAISQDGKTLWSTRVGAKVNELAGMERADSNHDAVLAGDDGGTVTIFDAALKLLDISVRGSVGRIDVGKLGGQTGFLVADADKVTLYHLMTQSAPIWYTPILGGLLACLVIAVVAVVLSSLKPAPVLQISAEEMTVEAQKARRRMLHESIQDLKTMHERGGVPTEAYLARIKDLRAQLAEVNAALIKLGEPIKAETLSCPHCGGTLEIGTDRCEYCGKMVLF